MKRTAARIWTPLLTGLLLTMPARQAAAPFPQSASDEQITHILNRIGFGPRPGDVERVRRMGIRQYIEQQLHPERIDDQHTETALQDFPSLRLSTPEIYARYPNAAELIREMRVANPQGATDPAATRARLQQYLRENRLSQPQQLLQELQAQKIIRAVSSERQLQEVMTDFWFNHFNVFWGKGANRWLMTDFEMNVIRPNTLGKFKDLLLATAKSPAMLFYLDNHLSAAPRANTRPAAAAIRRQAGRQAGINENYARELLELHTLGVNGGYTQKDVQEVARAFTGWSIQQPRQQGTFVFRPMMHDREEKVVLGKTIPAGGGIEDGEKVIEILASHPATARFLATKLVRRFVSDEPPAALVNRVAETYMKTGGDIREMLRTILFSDEFMSAESYGQKTKSAFEFVVSAIRALDGETDGRLARMLVPMGQPLYQYQAPTGFPDRREFWINNGTVIERINFAIALASNRVPGTTVRLNGFADASAAAKHLGSPQFQKR